ncbi:MAG: hypothetical protein V3U43_00565, partial [Pseudomonadales bacterium]
MTQSPSRPVLVWFISLGYGFASLVSLVYTPLLLSGVIPVPEPYRSDLAALGSSQWFFSLGGAFLMIVFCVALFRLRATAVHWCEALIALSLATTGYQFVSVGVPTGAAGSVALVTTTFSLGLLLAI